MSKLSRRQVLLGLGAAGTGALLTPLVSSGRTAAPISPSPIPSCSVQPQSTEGPFYFEANLIRKDITEGRPGTRLLLKIRIVDGEGCTPVRDAVVDIWSCDALGEYSGYETVVTDLGREQEGLPFDAVKHADGRRPAFHQEPNNDHTFLRGAQVTDANGDVEFETIYPGWYPGRTPHIHVKVYLGAAEVFTSQIYFPDDVTDEVYARDAYARKEGQRLSNAEDSLFNYAGGGPVAELTQVEDGYVGTLTFGVKRA